MSNKRVITMIVDHAQKTIRPISVDDFYTMLGFFEHNTKVTVTVERFVREGTISQSNLFHKYISLMNKETEQGFESCKTEMKRLYGARDDNGKVKSTTVYSTVEWNRLIEGTYIFMVQQLGMHVPRPEDLKDKNIK